ncbi:unnamed protein product [Paramecium sonneborni]|uniref:Uncharacterized protein n=1 Tax=Paramecium sonneborni TaxID=65129 RepID=A0A8S1RT32_9CILI|nr:unnamed protein product [Paramecium sonneborni]
MALLNIKSVESESAQFKELNSHLQIQESFQNLNAYIKVINVQKPGNLQ